jgi:hypothetical protein
MDAAAHRTEANQAYNRAWGLLEVEHRSVDQDADLLTSAFTSRYHWQAVGGSQQWIVADWMVSRAAVAVGMGQLALLFAERAYGAALQDGTDWLEASAAEGVARAYAAAGDLSQRDAWCAIAVGLVTAIGNRENRAVVAGQLAETVDYRPPYN